MPTSEDEPLSRYFGDYPDGAYWSAEPREAAPEAGPADHTVNGSTIRFMWDYGVRVPLWDDIALLPDDPDWLRAALGLSDPLIRDLTAWGREMNALDAAPRRRTQAAYDALDVRARVLVRRLEQEIGSRFSIEYVPW
ncbi:hypothetical protein GCM10027425_09410 [Alteromonas gracilis]